MILVHPAWVARAGAGDVVRHFQTRGFDVSNVVGSRFFHLEPHSARPSSLLDETLALFRPNSQRKR